MNENKKDKIKKWKNLYGSIFSTKIKGQEYIYRTLNVRECEEVFGLLQRKEQGKAEDVVFQSILYPEDFDLDKTTLNVLNQLYAFILNSSKVFNPDGIIEVIEKAQEVVSEKFNTDFFQWKVALMGMFPGYSLSDLDKMSIQEFFNLLVLGEKMTGKKLINYGKIGEEQEKKQKLQGLENIDTTNIATGNKFLSKSDLDQIAADQATEALKKHWIEHKK